MKDKVVALRQPDPDEKPGFAYDLSAELGAGRHISIAGTFGIGTQAAEMSETLDTLSKVIRRQQIASEIDGVRLHIKQSRLELERTQRLIKTFENASEVVKKKPNEQATHTRHQEKEIELLEAVLHNEQKLEQYEAILKG